jgi:hypothetical protein
MSKVKEPHCGVVGQGEFRAHRRFFPTYSVQLGTDNEQQYIDMSNNGGRVLLYAFRLPLLGSGSHRSAVTDWSRTLMHVPRLALGSHRGW